MASKMEMAEESSCTFCGKCDSTLEEHIRTQAHQSKVKSLFCHFCGLQLLSDSERMKHREESDHNKQMFKRHTFHPLLKLESTTTNITRVLTLRKLVCYLYYSNAFPYEVTLEHLKYYQSEISSLIEKHQWSSSAMVDSPILVLLEEDLRKILDCDTEYNSTRIDILKKIISLISLMKIIERESSDPYTDLYYHVQGWNQNFAKIIEDNCLDHD
ncbi:uncharacterized protein LOC115876839 [Sitophilus oryzae]|uniref:Uncharacterized protein LOC115876839 n=1 Tax=Sitophilus oryzae TaxID=7048 RepID=A0A6J2XBR5_SITOR|nr:uncharacterized protein LOC115876839 [Sitophilus oryzae]